MFLKFRKIICMILAVTIFVTAVYKYDNPNVFAALNSISSINDTSLFVDSKSYNEYLAGLADRKFSGETVLIDSVKFSSSSYSPKINTDDKGRKISIISEDNGFIDWMFNIQKEGFYNISVDYRPLPGKGSTIVRSFYIDGELPYRELRNVSFSRVWTDEKGIQQDSKGNDLFPTEIEKMFDISKVIYDTSGISNEPLKIYLTKGLHKLTLEAIKEPLQISRIKLFTEISPISYAEIEKTYKAKGYTTPKAEPVKVQAENTFEKSDSSLLPGYDRSTPATEPNDPYKLKLNMINGEKWQDVGQWISWQVDIKKSGLYKIGIKYRQNLNSGFNSTRKIFIDNEILFKELESVKFPYSPDWNNNVLGNSNSDPYEIYLSEGIHTIKMEASTGDMAETVARVNSIVKTANGTYRKLLLYIGSNPDLNRDYNFEKIMPEVILEFKKESDEILSVYKALIASSGIDGENVKLLKQIYTLTKNMAENPETIARQFINFQGDISALATWVNSASKQPLSIDYLMVLPLDGKMPAAKSSLLQNIMFSIQSFLQSFYGDYSLAGKDVKSDITVWVGSGATGGRDQAQILKALINNYFTKQKNIKVTLQLISMGALLPATLAGQGPDTALSVGAADPMNYAARNSVYDMTLFNDYKEIEKRFTPSSIEPFKFNGGVYGLPETQSFPMMFYRKDILSELGIDVPKTWTDVMEIIPVLQKKQFVFGLNGPPGIYSIFLYQNGGQYYSDDRRSSAIDSKQSIEAFSNIVKLYVDYQLPITMDFLNRFRSGESPVGIADFTMFNQLSVFAPELNGLWEMVSVPSTIRSDGFISDIVPGSSTGCFILKDSKNPVKTWEFLKWWTSSEIQSKFGNELEIIMGKAARYPTANLEAFQKIPWENSTLKQINEQRKKLIGIPEVPGGYYTPRYFDFAFRKAAFRLENPGNVISDAANIINIEITDKRKEFGLDK